VAASGKAYMIYKYSPSHRRGRGRREAGGRRPDAGEISDLGR
jgi:hypothetical protein